MMGVGSEVSGRGREWEIEKLGSGEIGSGEWEVERVRGEKRGKLTKREVKRMRS